MYTVDVIPRLLEGAEKYVLENERLLYKPFFEVAEKFCSEHDGVIGGKVGIDLLTSQPFTSESFMWDIYIDNTFEMAKSLTRLIAAAKSPIVPAETAEMRTVLKHREFVISVNARALMNIFALDKYRGVKLAEVMQVATRPSYFTGVPLKCFPEYMQMGEVYHTLYSPAKARLWEQAAKNERLLAANMTAAGSSTSKDNGKYTKKLLDNYFTKHPDILIGDGDGRRLQFLSAAEPAKIAAEFGRILGRKVSHRPHQLNIPSDFRLTKHTLYDGDTSIGDVFNSPAYELIPFTKRGKLCISHQYVTLRFLFIDIWMMRVLAHIRPDMAAFTAEKIAAYTAAAALLRKSVPPVTATMQFAGVHTNENVAKKKMAKEAGMFFSNFYPIKEQQAAAKVPVEAPSAPVEPPAAPEKQGGDSGHNDMGHNDSGHNDTDWRCRMLHELVGIKYASLDVMMADYERDRAERTIWGEYLAPDTLARNLINTARLLPFTPRGARRQLHLGAPADHNLYCIGRNFVESDSLAGVTGVFDLVTCVHANVTTEELRPHLAAGAAILVLDYDFARARVGSDPHGDTRARDMIDFELKLRGVTRSKWLELGEVCDPIWIQHDDFYPVYAAYYKNTQ